MREFITPFNFPLNLVAHRSRSIGGGVPVYCEAV